MMEGIRSLLVAGLAFAGMIGPGTAAQAQSSPSPYTSATRYDAMGRVVGTISADPDTVSSGNPFLATRTTYDARGLPTAVETGTLSTWQAESVAPASWSWSWASVSTSSLFTVYRAVTTTYDAMDRKLTDETFGSDGNPVSLTQYSYDNVGRLQCTAVRMNPAVYGSLPADACTLGTQGSDGPDRITRNYYDAAGQLTQVRKAVGTSDEQAYATYTYTDNGKPKTVTDANGNKAQYEYDGFDRQIAWIFPSKTTAGSVATCNLGSVTEVNGVTGPNGGYVSGNDCEKYFHDANGNRAKLMKRDGSTLSYTYDALNRVTVKIVPAKAGVPATDTRSVFYGYDLQGHQLYARFDSPTGEGVSFTWNGFGEKTGETLTMDGVSRTLTSHYDPDGNRDQFWYPDNQELTYAYDQLDRLTAIQLVGASYLVQPHYNPDGSQQSLYRLQTSSGQWGATDAATNYGYDPAGRLYSIANDLAGASYDSTITFTARNAASQITGMTRTNASAYAWAGTGNGSRSYTANGLNQYSAVDGTSFTYDPNGNLTHDNLYGYTYDVENRLIASDGVTLRYDPLGRLYEVVGSVTGTTRFLYDGDALVAEYNGAGTLLRRYVHGTSAGDDPLVWFEGSGVTDSARRYLYADERGSIVAVSDGNGNELAINTYDEYGIPDNTSASWLPTKGRFRYTGQTLIPELGMYYYKARMYSPTLGRFMQTDPIGYKDQINLYAYVGNDPVNGTDFSGNAKDDEYKVGPVTVGYNDSGIILKVETRALSAEATATNQSASVAGRVGDVGASARADTNGASASVHAGNQVSASASATTSGAAASARAGSLSVRASADRNGASVSGSAGGVSGRLEARTEQPDKVPSEFRGREGVVSARTGTPTPRTFGQIVMEGLRAAVSFFNPWKDQ